MISRGLKKQKTKLLLEKQGFRIIQGEQVKNKLLGWTKWSNTMNNRVLISTAPFDGYDLKTAIEEIAAVGADGVEVAFIEGYTDPFTEETFNRAYADEVLHCLHGSDQTTCNWNI